MSAPSGEKWPPMYLFMRGSARLFFALMGGRSVYGAENLPATGPAIVASNHVSMTDPPLVPSCIERPIYVMAKEELFHVPVVGFALRNVGSFPVKRGTADRSALRTAISRLEEGHLVLIFPEGGRGDGVTLQPPQRGMGLIAMKADAPIIPAYVDGTYRMLPRGAKHPRRTHVSVTFGKPILPDSFRAQKGGDEALGEAVMAAIAQLKAEREAAKK